jgi:hypothetical protein
VTGRLVDCFALRYWRFCLRDESTLYIPR